MQNGQLLKKDLFGEVWRVETDSCTQIVRDSTPAPWWTSLLARTLLRREAEALAVLEGVDGVPQLIRYDNFRLVRHFVSGEPLFHVRPSDNCYFRLAMQLLRRLHRRGVAHNDLAKEPNILVTDDGLPAFIDFQLATCSKSRGRWFRLAAREDIRHLLKHKRCYRPDLLTARERRILDTPSLPSRIWMATVKPVYLFVTRRVLNWSDREGAADRGRQD